MTSSDMQRSIIEAALTAATFDDAVAVAKMLQENGAPYQRPVGDEIQQLRDHGFEWLI